MFKDSYSQRAVQYTGLCWIYSTSYFIINTSIKQIIFRIETFAIFQFPVSKWWKKNEILTIFPSCAVYSDHRNLVRNRDPTVTRFFIPKELKNVFKIHKPALKGFKLEGVGSIFEEFQKKISIQSNLFVLYKMLHGLQATQVVHFYNCTLIIF